MCHMFIAFPPGEPQKRPFKIENNIAYGPGVSDMKSGCLSAYYALKILQEKNELDKIKVCVLYTPDEEISSVYVRPLLERISDKSRYVFAPEPARANGDCVNGRRGVAKYVLTASGVKAHSGVNPLGGSSAINELANWVVNLHQMSTIDTTVNVGRIEGGAGLGGTIASEATAYMYIRFNDMAEIEKIDKWMQDKTENPFISGGAKVIVSGGVSRPPMNPSAETYALFDEVTASAKAKGIDIAWQIIGGAGDACFTAIKGIPSIDGLGPIGGDVHSEKEYMLIDSVEPRLEVLCEAVKVIAKKC